ncbi:LacI family DNA-binding transcriptional regulator [Microbacterium esteraromaticum]|uniref:LacI family DNA-binding transcriptional regulator n=1 Tax=Microbacterium esteraromaticum TaxID=57043 RepID=A0A939DTN8_9MICO|nr:LacI family DNA-binding transcriptional regulator [Microbacterium esteraromaticum]MBN8204736.1 LacI family DNA-binding transcriptional regulator [Microbacterium esteraromaticum]MBN8414890.1 LacI family DNA-binding transcriptional regulator [Microbacterium esteraromaticum]
MSSSGRRATIADVAREAGVSTSTASVVFSGKVNVAEATRERVLAAADALGYAGPDPRAASLRTGRSGIVGVLLGGDLRHAFLDPVTTVMMDGLTEAMAADSVGLLLLRDDPRGAEAPPIGEAPVDAVVLIGCSARTRSALETVRQRGLPAVVIEGDAGPDVPQITLNNREASAEIARHLFRLGHRRVKAITLPLDAARERSELTPEREAAATVDVTLDRLAGFREVYPQGGGVSAAGSLVDEGNHGARMLLADPDGRLRDDRPTAIVAQSDLLAVGAIRAAEELGLRVPEDLSVVGFDGISADGLGSRRLTTITQPALEKGRAAGTQISRMLAGEPGESVHFTCVLRVGGTSAAPRA